MGWASTSVEAGDGFAESVGVNGVVPVGGGSTVAGCLRGDGVCRYAGGVGGLSFEVGVEDRGQRDVGSISACGGIMAVDDGLEASAAGVPDALAIAIGLANT